jgi:regulator of protease activity HflC (stomatin/prohibitin superfamily)
MENQGLPRMLVFGIIGLIVIIIFGSQMFITVAPGEKGVLFKRFSGGLDHENLYGQGFHFVAPWNYVEKYNIKYQTATETIDVLDTLAQKMSIEINVRFAPEPGKIGYLHEDFGQQYIETLVKPEVSATARRVMADYKAEEIYSTKRKTVEKRIIDELTKVLADNHVVLQTMLIKTITLSEFIQTKIDEKLGYQQEREAYVERLKLEDDEITRKQKEAQGIKIFMDNTGFTQEQYLKLKGIEATKEISTSSNAKFVISSGGELPVLLQTESDSKTQISSKQ